MMITKEQILGLVRHFITILGGIFIAKGLADESTMNQFIGAGFSFFGSAWSIFSKAKKK